ncbi:SDR family oxidoreductase [Dyadobacter sp. LJ53]|uniref:SDR family oxidoreductase n=1 Tax=Dyadobacter chenwenxiniae TaxID=2906456 RepID=UPI001F331DE5|nr:SDR family oxidoreductase [Dyadobacter chenwenxiniae]MCF0051659.1 SDR family oxidoreductase [Dyadobacter chenwenxiniae]
MDKTIFITGASSGLGRATAKLFASKGWNVIATMRNPDKELELKGLERITLLPLDVTNVENIEATVKSALSISDVDVLFNNAGYGLAGPLEAYSDMQISRQFETNTLGMIRTAKAFIPHFRTKQRGIIINTTSIGGLVAYPLGSIYHATKWAVEGWSEGMWFEMALHNISIKTVSPGGIKTDFMGRSLDAAQHEAYAALFNKVLAAFNSEDVLKANTPESIAAVVYEAATDGKKQLRYLAGDDAVETYNQRLKVGPEAFKDGVAQAFEL